MGDQHRHRFLAVSVRRLTEMLARASSVDGAFHHQSFVEQVSHRHPATDATVELRAFTQHARVALWQSPPSPVPIVVAALVVCLGQVLGFVAPASALSMASPASIVGELSHLVGLVAVAAAVVPSRRQVQRSFIALGLFATGLAQLCVTSAHYTGADAVLSAAVTIARVGEGIGMSALALILLGLTGRRRTFALGWRCLAISIGVLSGAQAVRAVAFARHGSTAWVAVVSLIASGGAALAHGLYRYVPFDWLVSRTGEPSHE